MTSSSNIALSIIGGADGATYGRTVSSISLSLVTMRETAFLGDFFLGAATGSSAASSVTGIVVVRGLAVFGVLVLLPFCCI